MHYALPVLEFTRYCAEEMYQQLYTVQELTADQTFKKNNILCLLLTYRPI